MSSLLHLEPPWLQAIQAAVQPHHPAPGAGLLQARHAARQAAEGAAKVIPGDPRAGPLRRIRSMTWPPCCRSPGARSSTTDRPPARWPALQSGLLPAFVG